MKNFFLIGLLFHGLFTYGINAENDILSNRVQFSLVDKAQELLTTEDEFIKSWSQFDIDSRLQKKNGTKQELLKFISSQVRDWSKKEKKKINSILLEIDQGILKNGYKINFPDEIYFVKTTGKEEGDADGYTRANYIVLKEDFISQPGLKKTIVHELFHILSRHDSTFRRQMYKIIGFQIMNKILYPDSIKDFRITNPDAPQTDSYIQLKKDGKNIDCMMILYSKNIYRGGGFFDYLSVEFLLLKGSDTKEINYVNGKIVTFTFYQISNFIEQVGKNTKYIIHPEEILADNFVFAIDNKKELPSQWIVDKIQEELK